MVKILADTTDRTGWLMKRSESDRLMKRSESDRLIKMSESDRLIKMSETDWLIEWSEKWRLTSFNLFIKTLTWNWPTDWLINGLFDQLVDRWTDQVYVSWYLRRRGLRLRSRNRFSISSETFPIGFPFQMIPSQIRLPSSSVTFPTPWGYPFLNLLSNL